MMPFIGFECLGDAFELVYKRIYSGGGVDFAPLVARIVHMLGQLADEGMLTNATRRNIETFLTKNISLSDMEVISRNTNEVVLVNTEIHEQESFELGEFITWITDELSKDFLMKKALCGRENYEGIKKVLNSYADKEHNPVMKENWVDFCIYGDNVFYTKKDDNGIHSYIHKMNTKHLPLSGETEKCEDKQFIRENLLDGRIYHNMDGTIFLETDCGYIVSVKYEISGGCRYSRIYGSIINQLDDGSILFIDDGKLIRLNVDGRREILEDNALLGMTCIEGNNVFWKCRFRAKDSDERGHNSEDNGSYESLKCDRREEKICKEILWKGLVFSLYNFDNMEFANKLGNRISFSRFFDKLPVPFNIEEILKILSEIEKYCYSSEVIKTDGYVEVMNYLLSVEDKGFEEKETTDALAYLLDNMTVNPYEKIATNAGTEVMTSMDFFFGDIDYFEDNPSLGTNIGRLSSDIDEFDIDAMIRSIDRKIAELEEEERKEKEAAEAEKEKKRNGAKNKRGRKNKSKSVNLDDSQTGRSADAVKITSGDVQ